MATLLVFSNKKDLVPNTLMLTHIEHFEEGQYDSETDIPLLFESLVMEEANKENCSGFFLYDETDIDEYFDHHELIVNEDCFDRLDHDEMIGSFQLPSGRDVTFFGVLI